MTMLQLELDYETDEISEETILKLKPYIQPFERYLARAELYGLAGSYYVGEPFSAPAELQIALPKDVPSDSLSRRLAYWEQIGRWNLTPTFQVVLEAEKGLELPNIDGTFHKTRRLRYGPHGIHEYRGKFFPQLVKSLINFAGLEHGDVVIDPMCGSGTTNCEARSMGMSTLGLDLNPLSVKISNFKTAIFDVDYNLLEREVSRVIAHLQEGSNYEESQLDKLWEKQDLNYLKRWFSPTALTEIFFILEVIQTCKNAIIQEFLEICLSNIIRPVSWQKLTDLRVRKEVFEYTQGKAINLFSNEIKKHSEKLCTYLSCFGKDLNYPSYTIKEGDSRYVHETFDPWVGKCDLLITSPPYATALPYIDTDRLSLIILDMLSRSKQRKREYRMIGNREISEAQRQKLWTSYLENRSGLPQIVQDLIEKIALVNHADDDNVGFRRRNLPALLGKYFLDMTEAMRRARLLMKPGSYGFYVVGNNSTKLNGDRVEISTDNFLWEIGEKVGWKKKQMINMELLPSRDIFRNNRGTSESILWFQA